MRNAAIYVIDEKGYELARHAATSFILTQSNFEDIHVFCHKFLPSSSDRLIGVAQKNGVLSPADLQSVDFIGFDDDLPMIKLVRRRLIETGVAGPEEMSRLRADDFSSLGKLTMFGKQQTCLLV